MKNHWFSLLYFQNFGWRTKRNSNRTKKWKLFEWNCIWRSNICWSRIQFLCSSVPWRYSRIRTLFRQGMKPLRSRDYRKAQFLEISKFTFLSLNCHFLRKSTTMITRMSFRNFTNSPDIRFLNLSRKESEFEKIREFTLIMIFVIFSQKWQFRIKNENFQISRNSAYSYLNYAQFIQNYNDAHRFNLETIPRLTETQKRIAYI